MTVGTWVDRRLGGRPRYVFCDDRDLVRIPDEVRECVGFLHARFGTENRVGSAFFLGVEHPGLEPGRYFPYLVTSRHCINHPVLGLADEIFVRLNTRDGGSNTIIIDRDQWIWHDSADVAVVNLVPPAASFEFRMVGMDVCADAAFRSDRSVGPGDDLFVTGLLVHHPGQTRIMPIVRLGCIAGLPDEPVQLSTGPDVVALAEVRSIGGISGSPVFVHLPFWRDMPQGSMFVAQGDVQASSGGSVHLLGVMHGFFPVGVNDPDNVSGGDEDLNTGIAVVTYIDRVLDIINHPKLVEERRIVVEREKASTVPIPTATATDPSEYDAFEDLTKNLLSVSKDELDAERKKMGR